MNILLKGARVVDATLDFNGDLYIEDGLIKNIENGIKEDCTVINCKGLVVMPSFIDTHCHFRDPGFTYKEDLLSGSRAAVKGGYTAVNLMANTCPVVSDMKTVNYILQKSKSIGLVDVHQVVSITKDFNGIEIDHLDKITEEVRCISEDGKGVNDNIVMLNAMLKAAEKGLIVMCHESFSDLENISMRLSENLMTARDIELSRYTKARLHICHASTKEVVDYIRLAKKSNVNITAEVTPHHIYLNSKVNYRVNPPLRETDDIRALIDGIKDGTIDCIGTDHAPHTIEDKLKGSPGMSGLETAFAVCYTALVATGEISLNKLSEIMSKKPGEILGFNKGEIKEGYDGDLVILDINKSIKVEADKFSSKGKNTPFDHYKLQ